MKTQDSNLAGTGLNPKMKWASILFIAGLLILTLYSNTILTLSLPKVVAEEGKSEPLVQQYSGSGVLQPISKVELSNKSGWTIKDVMVKAGDHVEKGQLLVTYESKEVSRRILDEEATLSRQKLMMEGMQERYIEAVQSGDDLKIRAAKRDLEIAQLDNSVQERKIKELKDDFGLLSQVTAPFEGVISHLSAVKGLVSGTAGGDVTISNASLGYQLVLQMPSTVSDKLELGSKQDMAVKMNGNRKSYEGVISGIEDAEQMKKVTLTVQNAELQGGEQANVEISISSAAGEGMLLPAKAVHGEGTNKYMFVIEEQKSPLGNTYHAHKVFIEVGEANEDAVIVLKGAYPGQMIITDSSEALTDGSRVRKQ
ncbi:efflux RND transporter periplasmic adaptor subunit [Paenibacillus sp. LMG 31458]|uniref:Efflux RND transporter periplasmic adaptor subunit n=1 Tax=Paenibacillus phytorum TaxID=2654977 RepID=A0ABX1XY03_9BACL|nr:efflux RND transporter periplasmic adaptor subunit [Paenibacillus phytorum]NOU72695.1 efflux RND transporter periplasmic adaptor subunit [Paenibacillus phytorum]